MLYDCSRRLSSRSHQTRIVFVIITCYAIGNIFFIRSMMRDRANDMTSNDLESKDSIYFLLLRKYFVLVNNTEYRLKTANVSYINCTTIASSITMGDYIASGWTKSTYRGTFNGTTNVAVKVVNTDGHDISECLKKNFKKTSMDCRRDASAKVLTEILRHSWLDHSNIAKMYGYCIPKERPSDTPTGSLAIITELGEPLDVIRLLRMTWEDRLRISLGLARLLSYMSDSIHGPMLVSDFRRQQFVLHDGEVKLSDLDDIGFGDPTCSKAVDCEIDKGIQVTCVSSHCRNFAERSNILKTGRHFMNFLLTPSAPRLLERHVRHIVDAYQNASWTADKLLQETKTIVELFSNGTYRSASKLYLSDYTRHNQSDLLGHFDYRCRVSMSSDGCVLSVFDEEEAAEMCSSDVSCSAFVVTNRRSWSGRKIVYFKNGYSRPAHSSTTTLYRRKG